MLEAPAKGRSLEYLSFGLWSLSFDLAFVSKFKDQRPKPKTQLTANSPKSNWTLGRRLRSACREFPNYLLADTFSSLSSIFSVTTSFCKALSSRSRVSVVHT
jgi:hypothetical protein